MPTSRSRRPSGSAGTGGPIEYDSVRALVRDFGSLPGELRTELRPHLIAAARIVASQAKTNASFSDRIPGAIVVSARFSKKSSGAVVRVRAAKAPHGRALEGITDRRPTFRHPVFGDPDTWVEQQSRPFIAPAAAAKRDEVIERVRTAVRTATTHLRST